MKIAPFINALLAAFVRMTQIKQDVGL